MTEQMEQMIFNEGYRRGKEDRPKGEWIIHKAPTDEYCSLVECPFCGEELVGEEHEYNFCPQCGADMRGEDNEAD